MHSGLPGTEKNPRDHAPHAVAPAIENCPAEHALQSAADTAPSRTEKVPELHFEQLPSAVKPRPVPYFPAVHDAHVELELAPNVVEYVPDWHSKQNDEELAAVAVRYVPAWHSVQLMMLETARPVEYVPELQAKHVCWTVSDDWMDGLYFPAGHASQFTPDQLAGGANWPVILGIVAFQPPTPVNPALHLQATCSVGFVKYVVEFPGQAY